MVGVWWGFVLKGLLDRDPEDEDKIYEWLVEQFETSYKGRKTPLVLMLTSAFFQYNSGAFEATKR